MCVPVETKAYLIAKRLKWWKKIKLVSYKKEVKKKENLTAFKDRLKKDRLPTDELILMREECVVTAQQERVCVCHELINLFVSSFYQNFKE